MLDIYDDIVVGGGSTGAVIAARLSEDATRRVLLIEAGSDYEGENMPVELLDPRRPVTSGHNWDISAIIHQRGFHDTLHKAGSLLLAADNKSRVSMVKSAIKSTLGGDPSLLHFDYPVGKVMGGSSSVNGALAMRGIPEDYDEWASFGNSFWNWPDVLEAFQSIESDQDLRGPYYGNQGPIPIQRVKLSKLHQLQAAFLEICRARGYSMGEHNNPNATGLGVVPRNVYNGQRISTAMAYLADARSRNNLTILPNTLVDKVLCKSGRASGVVVQSGKNYRKINSNRIILAAGAINTPLILMRSGIGPASQLKDARIEVQLDLPGVGENLIDHAAVAIWGIPADGACKPGEDIHEVVLRYTADASTSRNDMALFMLNSVETEQFPELRTALGAPLGVALSAVLSKPKSRGRIEIHDKDPMAAPTVIANYAEDSHDLERLMEGVRLAWAIMHEDPLHKSISRFFAWNQKIIDSDKLLRESILTFVRGSWHAVGTARMGPDTDPMAVVNQHGSVHGFANLVVADASIMPTIPSAPTNLTCIMIGERISKVLRGDV